MTTPTQLYCASRRGSLKMADTAAVSVPDRHRFDVESLRRYLVANLSEFRCSENALSVKHFKLVPSYLDYKNVNCFL